MTTSHLMQTVGVLTLLAVLLLALAVLVLRLAALPLAATSLALDHVAALAARFLPPMPVPQPQGGGL